MAGEHPGYGARMRLSKAQREFLDENHGAAMITVSGSGMPKAVRVGVALIGDQVWSSGTEDRVRTARLRDDPRCVLFVFGSGYEALTLEGRVDVIDGATRIDDSVTLFREMQGRPDGPLLWHGAELEEPDFRSTLEAENRIVYALEVERAYGVG